MSQARIENYIEQLGKISLKHHKENVEMMKLVDKLIESIQSGKELSTELEGDMIELLKALKAERNDAGSKKNLSGVRGAPFKRHQCGPEYPERRSAPVSVAHTR